MRKTATFVTLALAAVFAVAAGEDKMKMSRARSGNSFMASYSDYKYFKSVTLTDSGSPITYTIAYSDGKIVTNGVTLNEDSKRLGYLYSSDDKYITFTADYEVYVHDIVTGKHDNKRWLYVALKSYGNLAVRASNGFTYTRTGDKYNNNFILAINTDFNYLEIVRIEGGALPVLGTYNEKLYAIGSEITTINGTTACTDDKNCFIYDIFGKSPKSVPLEYYQSGREFYPIKTDSDDTAIVVVKSDISALSGKSYMFIFKKNSTGHFSLDKEFVMGTYLKTAAGEYKNGSLYAIISGGTVSVFDEDMSAYDNPTTVVFATSNFSKADWIHPLPFSIPAFNLFKSSMGVLGSKRIIVSFAHNSDYTEYLENEIFLRGTNDIAVILLDSSNGDLKDFKRFGYSNEKLYIGDGETISEGSKFQLNVLSDNLNNITSVTVELDVTTCINGVPLGDKCLCEDGYYGDSCDEECSSEYCSGFGECYVKNNQATCICNYGYHGDKCQNKMYKNCSEHGNWYVNENGEPACACNDGYTGENCAAPPPSCHTSDSGSGSPQPTPGHESGSSKLAPKPTPQPTPELPSSSGYCSECAKHCKMDVAPGLNPFTLFFH